MAPFAQGSPTVTAAIFAAGAALVWAAGTRLARNTDALAERTGAGRAFLGALLLGGVTSLPEIAVTVTASLAGDALLAVNNLFGGVSMQIAILAFADVAIGARALSETYRHPEVLLEGTLLILTLTLAGAALVVGDRLVLGLFGGWTLAVFLSVVGGLYLIKRHEVHPRWQPIVEGETARAAADDPRLERVVAIRRRGLELSRRRLAGELAVAALGVLVGGVMVALAAEGLAEQTGLGSSFVGVLFVAVATSLPEISTTLEAVRLGENLLAFSNIFGTNLFDVGLLFVADVAYRGGPILDQATPLSLVAVFVGLAATAIYLAGILERRDKTILRMGIDSALVLLVYLGGLVLLYRLR